MKKKTRYTDQEKALILKEHIDDGLSVSQLASKYNMHPNVIYNWKNKMIESVADEKTKRNTNKQLTRSQEKIRDLEETLAKRENIITELVSENIELKKKHGISLPNGQNLRQRRKS